ncbi:peptidase M19 [Sphingomonas sp. So64.6b]|uniref:dipeptidase n=1 Tax=Sphingomonas sp. So64.6b TaxID=2997354 RepID=UPI00160240B5|nr:membrane dipeptidase [Sphingomonas sp. So64.6b]QNA83163.1 peptidase M19 [Sphingomonas sp. So64.6b]
MNVFGSIDRRKLLGAALLTPLSEAVTVASPLAGSPDRRRDAIIVNSLGELNNPNAVEEVKRDSGIPRAESTAVDPRAIADARASGLTAVNLTLGYVAGNMDPFVHTVREIALWDRRIRANPVDLMKVHSARDILRAKAENRIGIIYGFQNATMMRDDATRVDIFADLGVRIIQLTYNPRNALGCGSTAPENCGLTDFGRQVVDRLNANRIMVDLSHSGEQLCLDAARYSKQPIAISHTGCRALSNLPRNKTDTELRLVAERGGYIGIYFMLYLNAQGRASASDVVAHVEHAVNVCGEDHVGIGTDGSITSFDDMPAYLANFHKEYEARANAGIAAPGEGPDRYPFIMDLRGPDQFWKLADLLAKRGFKEARIEKILGRNFIDYAQRVWGS